MGKAKAREEMSNEEERSLLEAIGRMASVAYPNPERIGCPGRDALLGIARKKTPLPEIMQHLDHITTCSPCCSELLEMLGTIRRRKVVGGTGLALLLGLIGWRWWRYSAPSAPAGDQIVTAVLDLRSVSITRGGATEPKPAGSIPRGNLELVIYLPVGSASGSYRVEFWRRYGRALGPIAGECRIEDGVDVLRLSSNTTALAPGSYELRVSSGGSGFAVYSVGIR